MKEHSGKTLKILIAGHKSSVVIFFIEILTKLKSCTYGIESADSLPSAIDRLNKNEFDIILLDLNLPGSERPETLRAVNHARPEIPIIVITDKYENDIGTKVISMGAQDYLVKEEFDPNLIGKYIDFAIERKISETNVINKEREFRRLIENSSDIISIVDTSGVILYESPSVKSQLGYEPIELIGEELFDFVHPDDKHELIDEYNRLVMEPFSPMIKEYRFRKKTESWCILESKFNPSFTAANNIASVTVNSRDITGRKRAEEELKQYRNNLEQAVKERTLELIQAKEELQQLSHAKDKALHHLSHELRTPISVLYGTIKIIKNKCKKNNILPIFEEHFELLGKNIKRLLAIQHETDKIIRMYNGIDEGLVSEELDRLWEKVEHISKIPAEIKSKWDSVKQWILHNFHGGHITERPVSLASFTDNIIDRTKKHCMHREINFFTDYEKELSLLITPSVLENIMEGLIKNAIENTPDGGSIHICIIEDEDHILVKVRDRGIGITPENKKHIFGGFFHTQDTAMYSSKKPYDFGAGGKGLGLLLARVYGQRFGFKVSFESERCRYITTDKDVCPGKIRLCKNGDDCTASGGSTATLTFPINKKVISEVNSSIVRSG